MLQPSRPLELREIAAALQSHPVRWVAPALAFGALAAFYALFLHSPSWEARQSLLIRDEAINDASRDGRLGRFEGLDSLKTAQETVLELARSRAVVAAALKQVGPPRDHSAPRPWPTPRDVEQVQGNLQVKAPHGAEFGQTEVLCLLVKHTERERALALTHALSDQLERRLQYVRDRRAQSLIEELSRTVGLARGDLEGATARLSEIERAVGGDLAELRMLSETVGGESNLRMSFTAVKNDLRAARVTQKNHQQLLQMLSAAQDDPAHLIATPNHLLVSQPALQRLKDGLVDSQLASARLQGNMTEAHPLVQAADRAEAEIRGHLYREIPVAIRGIQAELTLDAGRVAMLEDQLAEISRRMERLAAGRAHYANAVSEVRHFDEVLRKAQQDLAAVRASQAAAGAASLLTRLEEPYTASRPSGPGKAMIVLVGTFGGLATGLGLMFLLPPACPDEALARDAVPTSTAAGETLPEARPRSLHSYPPARSQLPLQAATFRRGGNIKDRFDCALSLRQALARLAGERGPTE